MIFLGKRIDLDGGWEDEIVLETVSNPMFRVKGGGSSVFSQPKLPRVDDEIKF